MSDRQPRTGGSTTSTSSSRTSPGRWTSTELRSASRTPDPDPGSRSCGRQAPGDLLGLQPSGGELDRLADKAADARRQRRRRPHRVRRRDAGDARPARPAGAGARRLPPVAHRERAGRSRARSSPIPMGMSSSSADPLGAGATPVPAPPAGADLVSPVHLVCQWYDRMNRGDVAGAVAALAPGRRVDRGGAQPVRVAGARRSSGRPRSPRPSGRGSLGDWGELRVVPEEVLAAGNVVVVLGRYVGVHARSGAPLDAQVVHVWDVVDGKIARYRGFADTWALHEATGAGSAGAVSPWGRGPPTRR